MKKPITLFLLLTMLCFAGCDNKSDDTVIVSQSETTSEIITLSEPEEPLYDFEYRIDSGKIIIQKYKGASSSVVIPENIEGLPVVSLNKWFLEDSNITELIFPEKMTELPCLMECDSLKKITLPSSAENFSDILNNCVALEEINIVGNGKYKAVD